MTGLSPQSLRTPTLTLASQFRTTLPASSISTWRRFASDKRRLTRPIPPPLPFVPDVQTFLTLIGRKMSEHASKIPSWEALFRMSPVELKAAGLEPPRARKYLLWWRERFRQGIHGIGGDFKDVKDGVGYLHVVEVQKDRRHKAAKNEAGPTPAIVAPGTRQIVVNVPHDSLLPSVPLSEVQRAKGIKWIPHDKTIKGSFVMPMKGYDGMRAQLVVQEGLWEEKRGKVVDGGERRKAEVRAKRKAAEGKVTPARSV